ncbi:hypothetical protein [Treponema endosymbiont of Eucomonympha sp.]|uniref:hypothetical protein n=1 Tax=Treponema endosymbiont of Eucomonympha sp. TaxID=1580831 RepID=UPI0007509F4A|nr:hypothetical protein [Treponema endosymbiont of Eucomonympha sp.]
MSTALCSVELGEELNSHKVVNFSDVTPLYGAEIVKGTIVWHVGTSGSIEAIDTVNQKYDIVTRTLGPAFPGVANKDLIYKVGNNYTINKTDVQLLETETVIFPLYITDRWGTVGLVYRYAPEDGTLTYVTIQSGRAITTPDGSEITVTLNAADLPKWAEDNLNDRTLNVSVTILIWEGDCTADWHLNNITSSACTAWTQAVPMIRIQSTRQIANILSFVDINAVVTIVEAREQTLFCMGLTLIGANKVHINGDATYGDVSLSDSSVLYLSGWPTLGSLKLEFLGDIYRRESCSQFVARSVPRYLIQNVHPLEQQFYVCLYGPHPRTGYRQQAGAPP